MDIKNIDGLMHEIEADDGKVLILLDGTETSLCYVPIDYPISEITEVIINDTIDNYELIDKPTEEDADNEQII